VGNVLDSLSSPNDLDAFPEFGVRCGCAPLSSMSDLLTVDENQHPSVAESPRQLSTNGSLTEVDSPNGDYKPDAAAKETDRTAHDTEEGSNDGDYDSEDDEDDDEEDDEEDEEPALKYERLAGSVPDLLLKDSASSLATTDKLIVRILQLSFSSG
jgi:hypothetical protein